MTVARAGMNEYERIVAVSYNQSRSNLITNIIESIKTCYQPKIEIDLMFIAHLSL